ncbi:MAG: hypothetical protein IKU44_04430 [Firmicutes bacterium]|nr:hypothetical protein [Bacillota bacterium]
MEKIIGMLTELEASLRIDMQYSAADKVLPILKVAQEELEKMQGPATHSPDEVISACVNCSRLP